ncbi:MAG: hypothetical protein JRI25_21170 [Deltaproteobacteria bacterium]|nr:hypothetical protein [Deltaproteobacteria bacterium]
MRPFRTTLPALLAAFALVGCDPGCDAADDLAPDTLTMELNDAPWTAANPTWQVSATGVQINTSPVAGWRLSMVGQETPNGTDVPTLVEDGDLPIYVKLGSSQDGGWGLLYPEEGDTFSTEYGHGGFLKFSRLRGRELYGCFAFDANDQRDEADTRKGLFRLSEVGLE